MPPHRHRHGPSHMQQRGAVFIIMLVILVMGSAAFLVNSLSGIGQAMDRDRQTFEALNQAKEALLAYAVNEKGTTPRPGGLPCPTLVARGSATYGDEAASCSAGGLTTIGRLPWRALEIPELLDADGEALWYVLSNSFRRSTAGLIINSDTAGTFLDVYDKDGVTRLTTATTVDKAVAVVFAPGKIVGAQVRGTATEQLAAANYLDVGPNSRNNAAAVGPFVAGDKTATFNDKLVFIKESELIYAVAKRAAGELKALLNTYYAAWNAYPFAVPFADPSTATYVGAGGTYYGLAPVDAVTGGTASRPAWNAVPSISFSDSNTYLYCNRSSGGWTNSRWRCCAGNSTCPAATNVTIPAGVTVTISGKLNSVGRGFWRPHDITTTTEVRARDSAATIVLASSLLDNVAVTGVLNYADGGATVTFTGTGKAGGTTLQRIELRDMVSYTSIFPTWFGVNQWERTMYYATTSDYTPTGSQTCSASCLTLDNKTVKAVVVATGGALSTQAHPSGTLSNYLEGNNVSPAGRAYENKSRSSAFNDYVISVSP